MKKTGIYPLFLFITFLIIVDSIAQEKVVKYDSGNKRNPFIPIVTNDGQLLNVQNDENDIDLNLEGIAYDKNGQSMAIINGEVLRKNDAIGSVKIIEIRKDSVVCTRDGEIFTLDANGGNN
ncbi:MAG: general secretion pathway protein GspB [Candidatus Omnitrophica bacterium]|nr:general secretion pathway protein GspB [Candidatus Omnitrophota bacterium]MDD5352732.1 general secretion pathway protein GspB [Candidatus Omnitrophota bacterium]MDD5550331.1 general secretion pathway protein GspB [Candidatus Omnitrophota bacterium]